MSNQQISVSLPLDADGFLRRECPTCERECKWFYSEDSEPAPAEGYACPYCAARAPAEQWFTKTQAEFVAKTAGTAVLGPVLDKFKGSGFKVTPEPPPAPLSEVNDMRPVDFTCHPKEPIKVRKDWPQRVHCIICAAAE